MGADRHEDVEQDDRHAALRRRHVADFEAMFPEYLGRIEWTADRVADQRRHALRTLLAIAVARSPWHRERLAGIDPGGFSEAHIESLRVMTKTDLQGDHAALSELLQALSGAGETHFRLGAPATMLFLAQSQ